MKRPYKPAEPSKPYVPLKIIKVSHRIEIDGWMSLDKILAQIPAGIETKDISIVKSSYDEYSGCGCCSPSTYTNVYVEYLTEEPNPRYDIEKARYDNKLKEYQGKIGKYKSKLEEYLKAKAEYDIWFSKSIEENRKLREKKELETLRKQVKRLEKKLQNVK